MAPGSSRGRIASWSGLGTRGSSRPERTYVGRRRREITGWGQQVPFPGGVNEKPHGLPSPGDKDFQFKVTSREISERSCLITLVTKPLSSTRGQRRVSYGRGGCGFIAHDLSSLLWAILR